MLLPPPGTAPGCIVRHGGSTIVVLPGPPWELETMWEAALAEPLLAEVSRRAPGTDERILRVHAVSESTFVAAIADLDPRRLARA